MARPVYGRDRTLQARMAVTIFSLGLLYVIGFGALSVLFSNALGLWIFIAVVLLIGQVWFSDRLALAAAGGRIVTPDQAPELHADWSTGCASPPTCPSRRSRSSPRTCRTRSPPGARGGTPPSRSPRG